MLPRISPARCASALLARRRTPFRSAAFAALLLAVVIVPTALQFTHVEDAGAAPGDHLWSKRFGDANGQFGESVTVDGSGNVFLTGAFLGSVDFGGGPLTSAGQADIFLAKFDPAGNHLWSKRFGDATDQFPRSVAVDGSGNAFLTGYFTGSVDFGGGPLTSAGLEDIFLAKFDPAGTHLWSKRFGDANSQIGQGVAVDGLGNVFLTGYFSGSVDFGGGPLTSAVGYDIFLAKFDAAGTHLWSKRFGDATGQFGLSVAVDGSGNVFLTGRFLGSADFGGGPLTSAGGYDIFLAKFAGTAQSVGGIAEQPGVAGLQPRSEAAPRHGEQAGGSRVAQVRGGVVAAALAIAVAGGWVVKRRRHAA